MKTMSEITVSPMNLLESEHEGAFTHRARARARALYKTRIVDARRREYLDELRSRCTESNRIFSAKKFLIAIKIASSSTRTARLS